MCALHQDNTFTIEIYYHRDCPDGHVAAFTLWLNLQDNGAYATNYHPIQYGYRPPDVTGKIVYILDISFPAHIIETMIEQSEALLIIDHHETAIEQLKSIPEKNKIFDITECGSTLTWKYLYHDKPLPLLYRYIKSRDLWSYDMENTTAFTLAFNLAIKDNDKYSFELTKKYLDDSEVLGLINVGKILEPYHNDLVESSLSKVCFCPLKYNDKVLIVAYVNTVVSLASDVGNRCMRKYPFVDFCACFYIDIGHEITRFQLRSRDGCQNVSVIAKEHGGGGHRNAAGCSVKGLTSKLNYTHMNSWPLWCIYSDRKFKVKSEHISEILTEEYLQLLQRRFPGKTLNISLDLAE